MRQCILTDGLDGTHFLVLESVNTRVLVALRDEGCARSNDHPVLSH